MLCYLDPKVKVIGKKAGICDGLPSPAALVSINNANECFVIVDVVILLNVNRVTALGVNKNVILVYLEG